MNNHTTIQQELILRLQEATMRLHALRKLTEETMRDQKDERAREVYMEMATQKETDLLKEIDNANKDINMVTRFQRELTKKGV